MERLNAVLNVVKIVFDVTHESLLVLFLKEYRENALMQIEEGNAV